MRNDPFSYFSARLLSDVLNPLIIPPLVLILLGWIAQISAFELSRLVLISLLFYFVIPFGIAFYLFHQGHTTSLDFPIRLSRNHLYRYSILSFAAGSLILFRYFQTNYFIIATSAIVFMINPAIGFFLNLKWKISIHVAALATAGSIFISPFIFSTTVPETFTGILSLIILLVLLPLMIWARYYLRLHSIYELFGGTLVGITLTLAEISILMRFA